MFTKQQELLLDNFADKSDHLFALGIISTDSFTGEIGEYVVCKHFNLKKSNRVTQAVDGVSTTGERFQVKSKVISKSYFSFNAKSLEHSLFDTLAVVYFDRLYNPLKIVIVPSCKSNNGEFKITSATISTFEQIDGTDIKINAKAKSAINEFAVAYNSLEEAGIIRSRRIVGDIGEFYACSKLNLKQSENRNEKGIDARHDNGLTFEIKTRRVYESGRRISETRRLNNLVGKTADYLIVVALDRSFKCAGMWIIPMQNLTNPKSANLKVVNTTEGTLNIVPSKIPSLQTGESFKTFNLRKRVLTNPVNSTFITKTTRTKKETTKRRPKRAIISEEISIEPTHTFIGNNDSSLGSGGCFTWTIVIILLLLLIGYLSN
ncbi:MAG: hypothetical protein CFE24_11685 [Flavobacterium sp. BFFFF2]|nr:MAG: hypothetical protein CFE24_11685 [Flavobacterium sp. BFFFF2]